MAKLSRRIERALEMPTGTLRPALTMELYGNREAVVEGCRRVLRYDADCIRLDTVEGVVRFAGEDLRVTCFAGGTATVSGRMVTLGFEE